MRAGVLWPIDLSPWAIEVAGPMIGGELRLDCEEDVKDGIVARGPGGVQDGWWWVARVAAAGAVGDNAGQPRGAVESRLGRE